MSDMNIKTENVFEKVDDSGIAPELIAYLEAVAARADIKRQHAEAARLLDVRAGERVLEVGCGLGADARDMARLVGPDGEVVAIDISAAMLAAAKERHEDGLPVRYEHGDVTALPYDDASFDAVRIERVLQHVPEVDRAIAEIVRVLRPGGRVVVLDPDWGSLAADIDDPALAHRCTTHMLSRGVQPRIGIELRRRLTRAGLVDVTVTPQVLTYATVADVAECLPMFNREIPQEANLLPPTDRDAWFSALDAAEARDELFVAFVAYVAAARKP